MWFNTVALMDCAGPEENTEYISQLGVSRDFLKETHKVLT